MWGLLGLDTEVVDQLVHHKLIFIGSQLKVSAEALGYDNDRLDGIVGLLIAVMRFVTFSDSRCLTVGFACRVLVGLFIAWPSALDWVVEEGEESQ